MRTPQHKTKSIKSTVFLNDVAAREAARLGEKGFSTAFIARKTGLSISQVLYRLKLAGIKRAAYRNGETEAARAIMQEAASRTLSKRIDELIRIASTVHQYNKKHKRAA